MPSGGRAVSLSVGCLSLSCSLSRDDLFDCCAAPAPTDNASDTTPAQAKTSRRRVCFISVSHCITPSVVDSRAQTAPVMRSSSDNGRMLYVQNSLPAVDADMLIVPWFDDDNASAVPGLNAATGGELERAIGTKELSGRLYELFIATISDATWKPRRIAFVGAGSSTEFDTDIARRVAISG